MITRERFEKHWELIEAYKNGKVIEFLNYEGEWVEDNPPMWDLDSEYRIKPIFKPKNGDVILVKNKNNWNWTKRIFVRRGQGESYMCLRGSDAELISLNLGGKPELLPWEFAKPLKD